MYSKTFQKIYKKIDSIAKEGQPGKLDYDSYIDDIINNNQFHILSDVLCIKYGIDTTQQMSINYLKDNTYDIIRFQTASIFQENLKSLFDSYSLYQMGVEIFNSNGKIGSITGLMSTSIILNSISVVDILNVLRYSDNTLISYNDPNTTLLQKYQLAITYLLN